MMEGGIYMAILDAKELAAYIKHAYKQKVNHAIPPIKLQKSLYFLFAYWGGFVRKGNNNPDFSEIVSSDYQENLFDNRIEAWVYGPVVPDVYYLDDTIIEKEEINVDSYLKCFIDDLLEDLFNVSDFKLVELSHNDLAWKNNFNYDDTFHNNEIPKEEIIAEYARK